MKKSMVEYITSLSDNNLELLEEIVENKYTQFTELYWLLKEHSEYISDLSYKDTKHNVLKIQVSIEGIDSQDVRDALESNNENEDSIQIWTEDGSVYIEIQKEEESL